MTTKLIVFVPDKSVEEAIAEIPHVLSIRDFSFEICYIASTKEDLTLKNCQWDVQVEVRRPDVDVLIHFRKYHEIKSQNDAFIFHQLVSKHLQHSCM